MSASIPLWVVENELFTRFVIANLELAVFGCLALILVRNRHVSPRLAACAFAVVLLKPIATLAFGNPLRVAEIAIVTTQPTFEARAPEISYLPAPPAAATPSSAEEAPVHNVRESTRSTTPAIPRAESSPSVVTSERSRSELYVRGILGVWILGALLHLARWVWDRHKLGQVLARSQRAGSALLSAQRRIANELGVSPPQLRITTEIDSPAIVGAFRRTVLLPKWIAIGSSSRLIDWSLRHELTHHREGDTILLLLRDIATSLFFFHPVARRVGRELEDALELRCDRAVAGTGAGAREYAEQLLTIVERTRVAPLRVRGAHAAGTRLTKRFRALLELGEAPHGSVSLTRFAHAIGMDRRRSVLAAALALSGCSGLIGIGVDGAESSPIETRRITGIVVDEARHAVPGAVVVLQHIDDANYDYERQKPRTIIDATTKTNGDGRFEVDAPILDNLGTELMLVVGHPSRRTQFAFEPIAIDRAEYSIALPKPTRVDGRILDLDGNPIAGARVAATEISRLRDGSLDELAKFLDHAELRDQGPLPIWCAESERFLSEATQTDRDGRFVLAEVPRDTLVECEVQVAGFEPSWFRIAVREDIDFEAKFAQPRQPVHDFEIGSFFRLPTYGVNFTHALKPARLVRGRVVDRDGVAVRDCEIRFSAWRSQKARTDAAGRFEIDGLPLTSAPQQLSVFPPASTGLIAIDLPVVAPVTRALEIGDVVLERGVRIRGRLVDDRGDAVAGMVGWLPSTDNPHVVKYGNAASIHSLLTDAEGRFDLVALPGTGIVTASSRSALAGEFLPARASDFGVELTPDGNIPVSGGVFFSAHFYDAARFVDAKDLHSIDAVELLFRRGRELTLEVVDSQGVPVPRIVCDGRAMEMYEELLVGPSLTVKCIGGEKVRTVILTDPRTHETKLLEIGSDAPASMRVQLEPPYRLRGRVVDTDGKGREGFVVETHRQPENVMYSIGGPSATCDASGGFELLLPGGALYKLSFLLRSTDPASSEPIELESKVGAVVDLGNLRMLPSPELDVSEG